MLRPILTTFVLGAGWLAQAQAPTSFKGEDVYNTHFDRPFHVYVDSSYPSFNSRNIQLRRTKDPTIDLVVVDRSSKVAWMIVKNQTLYDYGTYRQTDYFTKEKIEGQTLYAFKFRRHTVAMNGTGYGDKPHTGFHLANIAPGQYRLETEPKNRTREYEWDGFVICDTEPDDDDKEGNFWQLFYSPNYTCPENCETVTLMVMASPEMLKPASELLNDRPEIMKPERMRLMDGPSAQ